MLEPDKKNIEILWKRYFETDVNSVQEAEHSMELNYIRTFIPISGKNFIEARLAIALGQRGKSYRCDQIRDSTWETL